jgi:rSAM/selenodomain-associated transferase 2
MDISIIIPTLNEPKIDRTIKHLKDRLTNPEIIIVDSSKSNETAQLARPVADKVLQIDEQSRGKQLNEGVEEASNKILMLMHADHRFPRSAEEKIRQTFSKQDIVYAAFRKKFDSDNIILNLLSSLNNLRSYITNYIQGDNLIVVRKKALKGIGGIPEVPIMEGVLLSQKLKKYIQKQNKKFKLISDYVTTSSRYFKENGVIKSIVLMQIIKWKFFWGKSPKKLKSIYYK